MPQEMSPGKPSTRRYSEAEKERAVRMVLQLRKELKTDHGTVKRVADQLGVGVESLRGWVKQHEIDAGAKPGTTSAEAARIKELEQEVKELRRANAILKSASAFFRGGARPPTEVTVEFIDRHRDEFGVEPICRTLEMAPSTYYAAKRRELAPSARAVRDAVMMQVLMAMWVANRKVYGADKLWKAARRAGHDIGRDATARLMRLMAIEGVSRKPRKVFTTRQDPSALRAPDLVNRDFTADRPDALWVTDLTYVPTRSGMAYVCFIVDAFSRRIVGWRAASHMRTDMVLDALEMARLSRGAQRLVGLVTHSDAGSQFTSVRFTERLDEIGARPSIGTVADSFDNALAETTNGLYKAECVRGPDAPAVWDDVDQLELETLSWVHWFNEHRLHGHCDDVPPAEFEAAFYAAQQPSPTGVGNQ
ncbi:MAG TPA: IS3 family transposase [Acidimicrobiaceae bacterium]|nr:IS3 family transposase [Acidimicrobiaceae bacterium]